MTDVTERLARAFAEGATAAEKIESLRSLRDLLENDGALELLAERARVEPSLEVRAAILEILLGADITRLAERSRHLENVMWLAAMEPAEQLRLAAVRRLAELGPGEPAAERLLAETLLADLAETIQEACLEGLARFARLSSESARALVTYARRAPRPLRSLLLRVLTRLDRASAEAGVVELLGADEPEEVKRQILAWLAALPVLAPASAEALLVYLEEECDAELRQQAVAILAGAVVVAPALFRAVCEHLERTPDEGELLEAFRHRLAAQPQLVEAIKRVLEGTRSARLRIRILDLLQEVDDPDLLARALGDPSPWVRWAAAKACGGAIRRHPETIACALAETLAREPKASLRAAIVRALDGAGRLETRVQQMLLDCAAREADIRVLEALAPVLRAIPVTAENRSQLLRAYLRVIREPFFDGELRGLVTERLLSFAYRDEGGLKECLKALLARAVAIEEVELLDGLLRTLESDWGSLAEGIRIAFYRFVGEYPRAPLHQWLHDFEALAPRAPGIRSEIPTIVALTGATWLLGAATGEARQSELLSAVIEATGSLEPNREGDALRLVEEAYESRTLRRRDVTALCRWSLASGPRAFTLLDLVLKIMGREQLWTGEIIDDLLAFLAAYPPWREGSWRDAGVSYRIRSFLDRVGPLTPGYRDALRAAFTNDGYRTFCRLSTDPEGFRGMPRAWDDEALWRVPYAGWPAAELLFSLSWREAIVEVLTAPPDPSVPAGRSVQLLTLRQLARASASPDEELLAAVGLLGRRTRGRAELAQLHDRALVVLVSSWARLVEGRGGRAVPEELATMAVEAFLDTCGRWHEHGAPPAWRPPLPLAGMNVAELRRAWSIGERAWDELWRQYAALLKPAAADGGWAAPAPAVRAPLSYLPVDERGEQLVRFLALTPLPAGEPDEGRWRSLLGAAREHHGELFVSLAKSLPEPHYSRLLARLS